MPKNKKIPQGQVYGYLRVSTGEQNIDTNKKRILKKKEEFKLIGPIQWIEEKKSGTIDIENRELGKWFETAKAGEIIIISELSRISREALEIQEFISRCIKKNIRVYALDCPIELDGSLTVQCL